MHVTKFIFFVYKFCCTTNLFQHSFIDSFTYARISFVIVVCFCFSLLVISNLCEDWCNLCVENAVFLYLCLLCRNYGDTAGATLQYSSLQYSFEYFSTSGQHLHQNDAWWRKCSLGVSRWREFLRSIKLFWADAFALAENFWPIFITRKMFDYLGLGFLKQIEGHWQRGCASGKF